MLFPEIFWLCWGARVFALYSAREIFFRGPVLLLSEAMVFMSLIFSQKHYVFDPGGQSLPAPTSLMHTAGPSNLHTTLGYYYLSAPTCSVVLYSRLSCLLFAVLIRQLMTRRLGFAILCNPAISVVPGMNWPQNGVSIERLRETEILKLFLIFIEGRPSPPGSLLGWIKIEGVFPIHGEDMGFSASDPSDRAAARHIALFCEWSRFF